MSLTGDESTPPRMADANNSFWLDILDKVVENHLVVAPVLPSFAPHLKRLEQRGFCGNCS